MTDTRSFLEEAMAKPFLNRSIDERYIVEDRKKRIMGIFADAASLYQYTSRPPSDVTIEEDDVIHMIEWYCADLMLKKTPTLLRKYKIDKMSQAPCVIHTLLKSTGKCWERTEPFSADLAATNHVYYLNNFQDVIEYEVQNAIVKLRETQQTVTVEQVLQQLNVSEICTRVFDCAQKVVGDFEQEQLEREQLDQKSRLDDESDEEKSK